MIDMIDMLFDIFQESCYVSPWSIKEGVSGPYGIGTVGGKMLGPSSLTFSTNGLERWE